jgi:hypothetical protein
MQASGSLVKKKMGPPDRKGEKRKASVTGVKNIAKLRCREGRHHPPPG